MHLEHAQELSTESECGLHRPGGSSSKGLKSVRAGRLLCLDANTGEVTVYIGNLQAISWDLESHTAAHWTHEDTIITIETANLNVKLYSLSKVKIL